MLRGLQKVHPSFTARHLTHYGGLYPLFYFFNHIQLRKRLERGVPLSRKHEQYSATEYLMLLLTSIIVGLERIQHTERFQSDAYLHSLLGIQCCPAPSTIRRFLHHWQPWDLDALTEVHNQLRTVFFTPTRTININLDTTVLTVYGTTEGTVVGHNPHKRGRASYQTFLGTEAHSGTTLQGELISGNKVSAGQTIVFLTRCLHRIPLSVERIRIRADAGFYSSELLDFLEDRAFGYAIVARLTRPLRERLGSARYEHVSPQWQAASFSYQPHGWRHPRRFVAIRCPIHDQDTQQLALFPLERYAYRVLVTNLPLQPYHVWQFYKPRAAVELIIEQLKHDLPLAKIPTRLFLANRIYTELILFAYDLLVWFKNHCLPSELQSAKPERVRQELFSEPAEFVRRGNKKIIRFGAHSSLQRLLPIIEKRIGKLRLSTT
jgi:hypothetical protein